MYDNIIRHPWGHCVMVLDDISPIATQTPAYRVKELHIYSGNRTSLQRHQYRKETWMVVEGEGRAEVGDYIYQLEPDKVIIVPVGIPHRITAKTFLLLIEVQRGRCYEGDIIRIEDDYGRVLQ